MERLIDSLDDKVNEWGPPSSVMKDDPPIEREEDGGRPKSEGLGLPGADLEDNPDGCFGQTDNPHRSTTNPLNANVHARSECPRERATSDSGCANAVI